MPSLRAHASLLAVLAAVGVLYYAGIGAHGIFMWDEAHYALLGRHLAEGDGYVGPGGQPERLRPPVLPSAVALVLRVVPTASDDTVRLITAVAALLCIALVYGCALIEAGRIAALAAALLLASFPEFWKETTYLLTEIPFMLFYTPAVFFFHRGIDVDSRNFLIAWPCFAVALMTRYTAVLFGPTCVLLLVAAAARRDAVVTARLKSSAFWIGPLLAAAMLVPMFARAWLELGDPLIGFRAAAQQLPSYSVHGQMPVYYYVTSMPALIGWLPALALPFAVVHGALRRDRAAISCAIAATVIIAWLSRYGWKEPRLVSAALPFLAIILGLGVVRWWKTLDSALADRASLAVVGLPLLLALTIQIDPSYARAAREIRHSVTLGYPSFLEAMEDVRRRTDSAAVVMGPNCYQISWYARRVCRPLPGDVRGLSAGGLDGVSLLIVTSFERGQPRYAVDLVERVEERSPERVRAFSDSQFWTKVIAAAAVAETLESP